MIGRISLGCAIAALAVAAPSQADVVLIVDLSVENQITITSTSAASMSTVSGSDGIGFYLAAFYSSAVAGGVSDTLVSGNLTSFLDVSDGTPDLFKFSSDPGLNVFSYTNTPTSSFVAGTQAFSGSGTWNISATNYQDMLNGNTSGDVWAIADNLPDLSTASIIGQWTVIPVPGAGAMLAVAGLVGMRRRRG